MSSTYNLRPGLLKLGKESDLSPATLHEKLKDRCPTLSKSRLGRIVLGYTWANWNEVVALAEVLKVDPYDLSGATKSINFSHQAITVSSPKSNSTARSQISQPAVTQTNSVISPSGLVPTNHAMPPSSAPSQGTESDESYRLRLGKELVRAREMLVIPKLPAPVWAAWRSYEKQLQSQIAVING